MKTWNKYVFLISVGFLGNPSEHLCKEKFKQWITEWDR